MEMQLHNLTVEPLSMDDVDWFIETAAVNMLVEELKRPELIHLPTMYTLAFQGIMDKTHFVAKDNGVCVGALASLIIPNMFNPAITTLAEVFWYVLPEYRQSKAGGMLLAALEATGSLLAHDTTLSTLPSTGPVTERLEKYGWKMEEYGFRKRNK